MPRDDRQFAQVFADSIDAKDRSIGLSKDSASRAANPRWKSMNHSGCGSGSGIGGHHGGSFSFFGTVGHQSSRSLNASSRSRPKRSASQAVWTKSAAIAAPNSWGGSGLELRATTEKRLSGPRGMMS